MGVDIETGVHHGIQAYAMAQAQPGLRHLCIEPDEGFHAYMRLNAQRLKWHQPGTQIELVRALVGQPGQQVHLAGGGGSKHALRPEELGQIGPDMGEALHTCSLDDIVAHSPMAALPLALIKSDVDGHDHDVLASAAGLMAQHAPLLYFECLVANASQQADFHACIDRLTARGYTEHWLFDNYGNLIVHATQASQVHQLLDYVWRQHLGQATRTVHYIDVLSATERHRGLAAQAVATYTQGIGQG
ncbi:hypothetical protein [Aquabacterium sp.]|uniref:FkbM family methyltransferase n=1 Tax=Aquabacterium sp. TaxID=1872578 RepID=UPI0025C305D1|nr:hypothetical protein [Aquabacterium sp.]